MLGSELQNKRKQDRKQDVYKLYSQGQNILPKVRKPSKTGQDTKTLISALHSSTNFKNVLLYRQF